MSKESNSEAECKENNFETSLSLNPASFPPPRTPLNSIQDPSQYHHHNDSDFFDFKDKLESARARRVSEKKINSLDRASSLGSSIYMTPRILHRHGKTNSETSSAQSTPARSGSRASIGGGGGCNGGQRSLQTSRGKEVYGCRVSKGMFVENSGFVEEVSHFELREDPSFWKDHNVQVLIRIRPLNTTERFSQGPGRCLKQESAHTLLWLGHPETRFTFDHVACETISQENLVKVAGLPMVENCLSGYNSCMFAYGQTGSGKTYTMMGEINKVNDRLCEDCGITPRIFEYLFSRTRMEEEKRRNENLKFTCKCSFLEIYNEQITDLLKPSSTNLQLREDLNKGVYVENLSEYDVRTVDNVIKLLLQGSANRKMAATHMNRESSRSHSVFTCIIESRWESDSVKHFRFARLNLVDLAGSERQKSSGAEGDRLKEAANINKSLSTLGLVIMTLVDLAHGKQRHIPYRDSRLTFLLQDSLGGNSKTTIIANVSPSICSSHETLSTLKFAQRAKLIQNNAKVNEDASGDVNALQREIQKLKDRLSFLMNHPNLARSPSILMPNSEEYRLADHSGISDSLAEERETNDLDIQCVENHEIIRLEAILEGAMRREKMADAMLKKLETEMEHAKEFACQREEDLWNTKMLLRFREEKIKELELFVAGSLPTDHYLVGENRALKEEIQLLQAKIERNPELTHFALENTRLHEQLQMFQKFYEQGEGEIMMPEISQLREQLSEMLKRKTEFYRLNANQLQDVNTLKELEACKYMNSKLMRDIEELQGELRKLYSSHSPTSSDTMQNSYFKDTEEIRHIDKYSLVESASNCSEYGEVMSSYTQHNNLEEIRTVPPHPTDWVLQEKLDKLNKELEKALALNCKYQEDQVAQMSHKQEVEFVREQVEIETSRTILQLQEEVNALQLELNEKLSCLTQENMKLKETIALKEEELISLCHKWESATLELTNFLIEGSRNLNDVSSQLGSIISSFPLTDLQIDQHVERAAIAFIEKEETILQLEKSLEDAQKLIVEMEVKLNSLREATIALNEYPEFDNHESKEVTTHFDGLFNEKSNAVAKLENKMKCKQDHIIETDKRFYASLLTLSWLLDCGELARNNNSKFVSSKEFGTHEAPEVVIDDERSHASTFLSKCEEIHATIEEADYLLNELMKTNENAKQSNAMWRHRYRELMAENSCLGEENEQLKSSVHIKDEENKLLLDEIQSHLTAAVDSFSLLEGGFLQLQRDTEQKYKVLHSDVLAWGREMHHFICSSRSLLQDVSSEVIETGLSFTVLCQCLMAKVIHEVPNFDRDLQGQLSLIRQQQGHAMKNASEVGLSSEDDLITTVKGIDEGDRNKFAACLDTANPDLFHDNMAYENMSLKQELARKETLLKGLLFDFSLLQETASTRKDIKDETEKLIMILSEIRLELEMKTSQLDDLLVQNKRIHGHLCATEKALDITKSDLKHAQATIETLSDENAELKVLLEDMHLRKSEIEEQLEEQKEVIKGLENEVSHMTSSADRELVSLVECLQEELQKVTNEKNHLSDEILCLNDKLEMVYALADENEALAVEARQGMEASKLYAEQKEEEVKILEHSIEELESTIHVLEKKVNEMDEEWEQHQSIRDSLEIELQALRQRLSTVENIADAIESGSRDSMQDDLQLQGRLLELHEAHNEIKLLEKDIAEKEQEIKQYKAYISEIVLHSEAQASQYQEKYKNLESMVQEERQNPQNSVLAATPFSRSDKSSVRARGSSSPFRCIANLVQQTNLEKDQELSAARLQIGELEAMLANRQKEVCTLNTRLAAAESMTHDVIRDLLGVKLDMTNLANLIDQHQVQRLVEEAHQQTKGFLAKEQEILNLRKVIKDLIDEKESFMSEASAKAADLLDAQVTVEQLRERDQLLSAQNEMLKVDKTNLLIKVAELDQMVKSLLRTQNAQQPALSIKEKGPSRIGDVDTTKGRRYPQRFLSQANNETPQLPRSNGNFQQGKISGHDTELKRMKHKS